MESEYALTNFHPSAKTLKKIDIINVYASTNVLVSCKPELDKFYGNLKKCMKNLKPNIYFIGGDFNSKIGIKNAKLKGANIKEKRKWTGP